MSGRKGTPRDTFFKEQASALQGKMDLSNRDREVEKEDEKESNLSSQTIKSNSSSALKDTVGFASLPNQVYRKAVKRGFDFNLMFVGESGLGKSTMINSLFMADIFNSHHPGPSARLKKTTKVETTSLVLREGGVELRLNIIDTPGFGDAINNETCWEPILKFVECGYEAYLNSESRLSRTRITDHRVHCLLYFISPNGHGLKAVDLQLMHHLHHRVNIIPVIAKADSMTAEECKDFKKTIMNEIAQHKIHLYDFPLFDNEDESNMIKKLKERIPFSVVGSNSVVEVGGRSVRARMYPWGVVEVENMEHNDFTALRSLLIKTHMQDLKDTTRHVHYENYRYHKLAQVTNEVRTPNNPLGATRKGSEKSPMAQIEEEKREHIQKMKKMEAEMEQVFESKVKEKLQKLKDSETDLNRRAEQMRKNLENQETEVVDRLRSFEMEKGSWEDQNRSLMEEINRKEKKKLF